MRFTRVLMVGLLAASLAACTATSTKNLFGRQKRKGPNLAGSAPNLTVPNDLHAEKIRTLYPVSSDVAAKQPHVSLVPPGSNLQRYAKQSKKK